MKKVIFIIVLFGYGFCVAQLSHDFQKNLIIKCKIDSCVVTLIKADSPPQLLSKISFNSEGAVHSESFPSEAFYATDSILNGFSVHYFHYDSKGRLDQKTIKPVFKDPQIEFDEVLEEKLVYGMDGRLLTHLYYSSFLDKIETFDYQNGRLNSKITTSFRGNYSLDPQRQTIFKKIFSYSSDGKVTTTASYSDGTLVDSIIEKIDSSEHLTIYTHYKFDMGTESTETSIYKFRPDWQIQKITFRLNSYEGVTKFSYNALGLLEKREVKGIWPQTIEYRYVFRGQPERNEEKE